MGKAIKVSICIPSYNGKDLLKECLKSIYTNPPSESFEVIVVDDASTDGTPEMIESHFKDVIIEINKTNIGVSKTLNKAFRMAHGKYIITLGQDTIVYPEAFDKLINFLESHTEAGCVGAKALNFDGTLQPDGHKFPSMKDIYWFKFKSRFINNKNLFYRKYRNYDKIEEIDVMSLTALIFRKEILDKVGYIDENMTLFYQDVDWWFRVKKSGYKNFYLPDAIVKHYWGYSYREPSSKQIYLMQRDFLYFCKKYYPLYQFRILKLFILGEGLLRLLKIVLSLPNRVAPLKAFKEKWLLQKSLFRLVITF